MDDNADEITFIPADREDIDWSPLGESMDDMNDPLADDLIPGVSLKEEPVDHNEEEEDREYCFNECEVVINEVNSEFNEVSDDVNELKNALKAQSNNEEIKIIASADKRQGCPEILPGLQKDSRSFHDGHGYYFRTNRKSHNIRYLRCAKFNCRARGQIKEEENSPIVLSYDIHNHRPLTIEEQNAKRERAFGLVTKLPPTMRLNCYSKKKDGVFHLVNLKTFKLIADNSDKNVDESLIKQKLDKHENRSRIKSHIVPVPSEPVSVASDVSNCKFSTNTESNLVNVQESTHTHSTDDKNDKHPEGSVPEITLKKELVDHNEDDDSIECTTEKSDKQTENKIERFSINDIESFIISELVNELKDALQAQINSDNTGEIKVTVSTDNAEKCQAEILFGSQKESRCYHDGLGHYFYTRKRKNSMRYLGCIKGGCRARGQIYEKLGSPIFINYDLHTHEPFSIDQQNAKRAKLFGQIVKLPPTKRVNCYCKKKDGSFQLVTLQPIKSTEQSNEMDESLENEQQNLNQLISECENVKKVNKVNFFYTQTPAPLPPKILPTAERLVLSSAKKHELVKNITRSMKPILPRPQIGSSTNTGTTPQPQTVPSTPPQPQTVPSTPPHPHPSQLSQVPHTPQVSQSVPLPTQPVHVPAPPQQISPPVPSQLPHPPSLPSPNTISSIDLNFHALKPIKKPLTSVRLPSKTPASDKKVAAQKTKNMDGKPEVLYDSRNIPVYYHDGNGYFYVLTLFRTYVRYLRCMDQSCGIRAKMDAVAGAKISLNVGECHNHRPLTIEERLRLRDETEKLCFQGTATMKERKIVDDNSKSDSENIDESSNRIVKIQEFKMNNNSYEETETQNFVIKLEPEDIFFDETGNANYNSDTYDDSGGEDLVINADFDENEDDGENNNIGNEENGSKADEFILGMTAQIKEEPIDDFEKDGPKSDNSKEQDVLNQELVIKEEEEVDEYLAMTVDNGSDEDEDIDGDGSEENNDNTTVNNDDNDTIISIPDSENGSKDGIGNATEIENNPVIIKNEIEPVVTSSSSDTTNNIFTSHNFTLQSQRNISDLVGIKVPIPKDKNDSRNLLEPANVSMQPQSLPISRTLSPKVQNVQNASPVLQLLPDSNTVNQNIQYVQLGPNGGFIQIPTQNNVQSNPYGFIMPPQFLPVSSQPFQNNPFLQMVQGSQPNNIVTSAPLTVSAVQPNGQVYQFLQNGQDKINTPQTISTVTGPDGMIYHIVQNNNPAVVSNPEQVASPCPVQILPQKSQASGLVPNTVSTNFVQPQPTLQNNEISVMRDNKTSYRKSLSQPHDQVNQLVQNIQGTANETQVKGNSPDRLVGQDYQVPQNDQSKMSTSQKPTATQEGEVYQVLQNIETKKASETVTIQQSGQVLQILPNDQGKITTSQTTTIQQNGHVYQLASSTPEKIPVSEPPQIIQQNGHTYQLVKNDQGKLPVPQFIQQGNQIYQILPNDEGKTSSNLAVPQSSQIIQAIQNDPGKNSLSPTIPAIQQRGQLYQLPQNDSGKGSSPQVVHCVQQNGQIYQVLQNNQGNIPGCPSNSNLQQNGQVFQVINSQGKSTNLPFQSVQQNGQLLQIVQQDQGKSVSQPVMQNIPGSNQFYQIVQSSQVKDNPQGVPGMQSNQVFQFVQNSSNKNSHMDIMQNGIPCMNNLKLNKIRIKNGKLLSNTNVNAAAFRKLAPLKKKLPQAFKKLSNCQVFPQDSKMYQILPNQDNLYNSPSASIIPGSPTVQVDHNEETKILPSTSQSITNLPINQIAQVVQGVESKLNTSHSDVTNTNIPDLQFVQSGQDKCIPNTVSSAQSNLPVQLVQNAQVNNSLPTIIGPNGQMFHLVQSSDTKVTAKGEVYQVIQSGSNNLNNGQVFQLVNRDGNSSQLMSVTPNNSTTDVNTTISKTNLSRVNINTSNPIFSTVQSGLTNIGNPQIISAASSNGQIFQVISGDPSKVIVPKTEFEMPNSQFNQVVTSNFSGAVPDVNETIISTTLPSDIPGILGSTQHSASEVVVSSASTLLYSQAQQNTAPVIVASTQLLQPFSNKNHNTKLVSKTLANTYDNSIVVRQRIKKPVLKQPSTFMKGYIQIAPAPAPRNDSNYPKGVKNIGTIINVSPTTLVCGESKTVSSEQFPGLNDDFIYHDGKGYYFKNSNKKKHRSRDSLSMFPERTLHCIREPCPAVGVMSMSINNAPIRLGLWQHNHEPLTTEEQFQREERLKAFERMRLRIRAEKTVTSLQQIFNEEMDKFVQAIKNAGFEPKDTLFDEDLWTKSESEFISELLARELDREEPEPTIAMSVKKRPRTTTINMKPLVDDSLDNNDDVDEIDNEDEFDENYGTSTQPATQKVKRRRGRPRKNKLTFSEENVNSDENFNSDENLCSMQEILVENIKAEVLDYDMLTETYLEENDT